MGITDGFLELFAKFFENYTTNANTSYLPWGKDRDHAEVNAILKDLLDTAKQKRLDFDDAGLIQHINMAVLSRGTNNPYLLQCWVSFIETYNKKAQDTGAIHVGANSRFSERLINDLTSLLKQTQALALLADQTKRAELDMLERVSKELESRNQQLNLENLLLKQQVEDLQRSAESTLISRDELSKLLLAFDAPALPKRVNHSPPQSATRLISEPLPPQTSSSTESLSTLNTSPNPVPLPPPPPTFQVTRTASAPALPLATPQVSASPAAGGLFGEMAQKRAENEAKRNGRSVVDIIEEEVVKKKRNQLSRH